MILLASLRPIHSDDQLPHKQDSPNRRRQQRHRPHMRVHHHLVLQKKRAQAALMVETAEAREVHHMCVLVGYGADAVCPWLVMESIHKIVREGL